MPTKHMSNVSAWIGLGLTILINFLVLTYQHGRLAQKVDDIGVEVKELKKQFEGSSRSSCSALHDASKQEPISLLEENSMEQPQAGHIPGAAFSPSQTAEAEAPVVQVPAMPTGVTTQPPPLPPVTIKAEGLENRIVKAAAVAAEAVSIFSPGIADAIKAGVAVEPLYSTMVHLLINVFHHHSHK